MKMFEQWNILNVKIYETNFSQFQVIVSVNNKRNTAKRQITDWVRGRVGTTGLAEMVEMVTSTVGDLVQWNDESNQKIVNKIHGISFFAPISCYKRCIWCRWILGGKVKPKFVLLHKWWNSPRTKTKRTIQYDCFALWKYIPSCLCREKGEERRARKKEKTKKMPKSRKRNPLCVFMQYGSIAYFRNLHIHVNPVSLLKEKSIHTILNVWLVDWKLWYGA